MMNSTFTFTALAAFASLSSAYFNLQYPAARGFDEDILPNFSCGGQNTVSSNRTLWPINDRSIALTMSHIDANVEVVIGFGNNPGAACNTVLRNTISETGLSVFCMTGFEVISALASDGAGLSRQVFRAERRIKSPAPWLWRRSAEAPCEHIEQGMNATIQAVTNGDPDGGLFNCGQWRGNPNGTPLASESTGSSNSTRSAENTVAVGMSRLALAETTVAL